MKQVGFILALLAVAYAQEHFIDVKELVKETIDAIKSVPSMIETEKNGTTSTTTVVTEQQKPQQDTTVVPNTKVGEATNDVYKSLLKLPADIMSRLAIDAGFVEAPKKTLEKVDEQVKQMEERKEKKVDEEESYSFKTLDDVQAEERRRQNDIPSLATRRPSDNDDVFSISKLISATGNAIREAQAQRKAAGIQSEPMTLPPLVPLPTPLEMPGMQEKKAIGTGEQVPTEVVYKPVTKDGKLMFEKIVMVKGIDGVNHVISRNTFTSLPTESVELEQPKRIEIKQSKSSDFMAPTFPPMVNLFDTFTSTTTEQPTTTTEAVKMEEEMVETTTQEVREEAKPRRRVLPRRKIQNYEKKLTTMHSRQFGAKTLQMSDPIDIQSQEDATNVLQKEGNLRVRTINRRRKHRKTSKEDMKKKVEEKEEAVEEKVEEEVTTTEEPPKKRRRLVKRKRNAKKAEKKEIRKLPDLYDEEWKTQVAPSVAPPSEDFVEQFANVDEVQEGPKKKDEEKQKTQNDEPMNDQMDSRSSKVQMMTPEQEDEMLEKEIHKRVLQKIHSAKTKSNEEEEDKKEVVEEKEVEEKEVVEEEGDEEEHEEEDVTTTTTTTTEVPVIRAERTKKMRKTRKSIVTKQQCLNLRSFARQFLFDTIEEFAKEHCYFVENYYPKLKCSKVDVYVTKCAKYLKDEE